MKKRYIVLSIVTIFLLPKIIDFLFSVYLCDFLSMNYIEAPDILSYMGVLIGVLATLITLYFTVKQFKLLNKTYIIPINTKYFFYCKNDNCFLSDSGNIEKEEFCLFVPLGPYHRKMDIELRNIGKGTANDFSIEFLYNKGQDYHNLMSQLGYDKEHCGLNSNFEDDTFKNCGIFLSGDSRYIRTSFILDGMITDICRAQYLNSESKDKDQHMKNNTLVNTEHKICSIKISSSDILDITKIEDCYIYDVYIKVFNTISLVSDNGVYSEAYLIMKEAK